MKRWYSVLGLCCVSKAKGLLLSEEVESVVVKNVWGMLVSMSLIACGEEEDNVENETEDCAVEVEEDYSEYCNEDPAQNLIEEDEDCDGVLIADDCDDSDPSDASIASDCEQDVL